MRLYHYVNENIKELNDDDMNFLIDRDCQPWIKASTGETVYRGANKPYNYKGTVRTDRKPLDTTPEVQELFDNVIQKKYGFKPRSNGLFVTGSFADARRYGKVYKIYPIGKFKFLWSPNIRDFYSETGIIVAKWIKENDVGASRLAALKHPDVKELLKTKILDSYTNKDLARAINSYKEIMVVTKEFYAVAIGAISTSRKPK